jgi:U3 small nucleolar RNA-associated protein 13
VLNKTGEKIICLYEGNIKFINTNDVGSGSTFFDEDTPYESVSTFCLRPDEKDIVIATAKFSIIHYILDTKQQMKTMKAHRMPILCMEYDPTGTLVVTGSADHNIRVWDVAKGFCTHNFSDHNDLIKTVYWDPNPKGLRIFSSSDDNSICCFDLKTSKKLSQFTEHVNLPTKVVLSTNGEILISCGKDKVSFLDHSSSAVLCCVVLCNMAFMITCGHFFLM